MPDGFVHTVFKGGQWVNEVEGDGASGVGYANKEEAVAAGRGRAKQDTTEHVIHNQDGKIGERNSYGNDSPGRPG